MELLNATSAVSTIVAGTTGYLAEFMPIFVFVIGLTLAFVVMTAILGMFLSRKNEGQKFNTREVWEDFID